MQQRRPASGRPTGTDGSDFNYRMVVDSRYQKVAKGKSSLYALIFTQAVIQLVGVLHTFLLTSDEDGPDVIAISSVAIGSVSLIIGELGRKRSRVSLLKVYMVASSVGILLSIACVAEGSLTLAVLQNSSNWKTKKFELVEATRTVIAFLVQIFAISTTTSLIGNMSPPKRAS
ncbi:protein jagunal homolog 1-like [Pyrus x bretschneideri]|uniref:protein jagunal homolog 1-like n=1 Tax=Pyrus x bretschneideri TaxID=225117 RepID=UPI00202FABE0|nr:protein jagunal homolog 1-like [Pyrus x bretschneideri]